MDWHSINEIDRQILGLFNGSDSLFFDGLISTLTNGWMWLPFYAGLLYVVAKNNTAQQVALTVGAAVVCILASEIVGRGVALGHGGDGSGVDSDLVGDIETCQLKVLFLAAATAAGIVFVVVLRAGNAEHGRCCNKQQC